MIPGSRLSDRLPVALASALIALSCAEYALSIAMEHSFPRDLNLAYMPLGLMYRQISEQTLRPFLQGISQPGGWFNGSIALWLQVFGRSAGAFNAWGLAWYALLLVSVFGLGRRWFGAWAGFAAVALVAQFPVLVLSARGGWIHIPEAALMVVGAWVLACDPRVDRWRSVVTLGLCGALAMALRPSGVVWTALLLACVFWGALRGRVPLRSAAPRLCALLVCWGLALRIPFPQLTRYLGSKMDIRERYAGGVRFIGEQVWTDLQPAASLLVLLGVGLALLAQRRVAALRSAGEEKYPLWGTVGLGARRFLLGTWVVGGVAAWATFRSGIDNFPLFFVALALVAGSGMAVLRWRWMVVLAALGWAGSLAVGVKHGLAPPAAGAVDGPASPVESPIERLQALLNATCPNRAKSPCMLVADQGLTYPASEDPGMLQLFLLKEDSVRLEGVHQPRKGGRMKPAAVATWTCRDGDAVWHDRFPMNDEDLRGLVQRWSLLPAWTVEAEGCSFWWLTENGAFAAPDAAPTSGRRLPVERPAWWPR